MTSSVLNAANFAFAILLMIAQILYIDHIRICCRQELKDVALGELRPLLLQISDLRRFTAMASDDKLEFVPLPSDSLEWVPWFENNIQKAQKAVLRVKNDQKTTETISYLSIYLMGYRWNRDVDMWAADVADIAKLTADEISKNAPSLLEEEKRFLKEDESLMHFHNARVHRQMQVDLRAAVLRAIPSDHILYNDLAAFNRDISVVDLYQGSRLLAHLTELAGNGLRRLKPSLLRGALEIATDIQANSAISKTEMHEYVATLERHVWALQLGGSSDAEDEIMEHVYEVLRDHPRPIIISIVNRAVRKGTTIAAFRAATLKEMPLDINTVPTANLAAGAHSATASSSTPSLLERVETSCTAMMSYLSKMASNSADSPGAGRGKATYTPEQQDAYISRLKAQNQAKDQTIRSLQNALTSASGHGGRGRVAGGGRGGRGRGRGRGRGKAQDGGDPEVDNIDASGFPEIFMANMQAGVEQQLAAEAAMDLDSEDSGAQAKSKSVPPRISATTPLSDSGAPPKSVLSRASATTPLSESSDDEAPPSMVDPPENEPPVYTHPGGPPPCSPSRKISWLLLGVGVLVAFVALLIVAAALDILPDLPSLRNTTILGGSTLLVCGNLSRRRFAPENVSPWIVVGGIIIVLFGVCQGSLEGLRHFILPLW